MRTKSVNLFLLALTVGSLRAFYPGTVTNSSNPRTRKSSTETVSSINTPSPELATPMDTSNTTSAPSTSCEVTREDSSTVNPANYMPARRSAEDSIVKTSARLTRRLRPCVLRTGTCIWMLVEPNVPMRVSRSGLIVTAR